MPEPALSATVRSRPTGSAASSAPPEPSPVADAMRRFGPAAVTLAVQLPLALWTSATYGQTRAGAVLGILLALAGPACLLAARRRPGPTVAVVAGLSLLHALTSPAVLVPYVALWFGVGIAVAHGALVWTAVSAGVAWVGEIVLGTAIEGLTWHPLAVALETVALAGCFGVGWYVWVSRGRAALLRAEALDRRRAAESRERDRIAGGLHDSLGQALSQAHVQASIALHLMDRDPERARAALERIRTTAHAALADLRSVVDAIREDDEVGAAELDRLPLLLAEVRATGLAASFENRLVRAPARPVQYAAYRIAEEAIANAGLHAGAGRVDVVVEREDDEFILTVQDDGAGFERNEDEAGGGLVAMRERAALIGGTVEIGESPAGGTTVTARLPWSDVA